MNTKRTLIIVGSCVAVIVLLSILFNSFSADARAAEIAKLAEEYSQELLNKQQELSMKDMATAQANEAQKNIEEHDKRMAEITKRLDELRKESFTSGEGKTATKQN